MSSCRSAPAPDLQLPKHAEAAAALQPLQFLVGRWVGVNPNNTVNEEHWMQPRGNCMIGVFRQVRLDGNCAFVEVSQISLEKGEVVLRLRHMHGRLEVPERRKNVNVFELVSATGSRVEFKGTGDAEGVTSVVYELQDADTLTLSIGFDPTKSREKPFTSTYRRA